MESIITQLNQQEVWEEFLAYRLMKGRLTWHEFEEADDFVADEGFKRMATTVAQGGSLGVPEKKMVNKMGSGKKRVVYSFDPEAMALLKVMAFLLYRYDDRFAPNCYAFRRGLKAHDAILHLNKALQGHPCWAYKLDIHDYFNSIPIPLLLPILKDLLADDPPLYQFFEQLLSTPTVKYRGELLDETHGVMAGTPTAPFLADVYLSAIDHHFHQAGVLYARYSDDIILFAPDQETLDKHKATLLRFLAHYQLQVNPAKEKVFSPDEPYQFLGFKCQNGHIDIADAALDKMKGKIKRKAEALMRWRSRKGIPAEQAMQAMIRTFNKKFFENDDDNTLNWSRWFFPLINQTDGLKEIDHYLQQNIRYLATGKHTKANYRTSYEQLKKMGYRSLVNEFHKSNNS